MPGEVVSAPGGEQAGHQVGLGADLDHRLHHLQAALDQRAHDDVAALADVLGGGDHVEIGIVDDRRELVADLARAPCAAHRAAPRACRCSAVRSEIASSSALRLSFRRCDIASTSRRPAAVACPTRSRSMISVEVARAGRDLAGDRAAVVRGLGADEARGRRRDLARRDREPQRVGHHRHFVARHALEAALGRPRTT